MLIFSSVHLLSQLIPALDGLGRVRWGRWQRMGGWINRCTDEFWQPVSHPPQLWVGMSLYVHSAGHWYWHSFSHQQGLAGAAWQADSQPITVRPHKNKKATQDKNKQKVRILRGNVRRAAPKWLRQRRGLAAAQLGRQNRSEGCWRKWKMGEIFLLVIKTSCSLGKNTFPSQTRVKTDNIRKDKTWRTKN